VMNCAPVLTTRMILCSDNIFGIVGYVSPVWRIGANLFVTFSSPEWLDN
jgi:hypothetical protein